MIFNPSQNSMHGKYFPQIAIFIISEYGNELSMANLTVDLVYLDICRSTACFFLLKYKIFKQFKQI